jgi:uroporphyrinogen-III synthase
VSPRVWVTRDEEPGGELCAALRSTGLEPVLEPVLARRIVADPAELLRDLRPGDWLVITSTFAARAIRAVPTSAHVAVVGEATARACRDMGLAVDLVSPHATGASLWPVLWPRVGPGARVFYPRSSLAEVPPRPPAIQLIAPVLYRTEPRQFDAGIARRVDVVTLASPSAVRRIAGIEELPAGASIGPTTSAAMREHGIPVWVESPAHTFDDLAAAIAAALRTQARP